MKILKMSIVESMKNRCSICGSEFLNPIAKTGNWQIMKLDSDSIVDELKECEVGDEFLIEIKDMSEEEYKALPEFVGY